MRTENTSRFTDGFKAVNVAYDKTRQSWIVDALKGQDALVVTVGFFGPRNIQEKIIPPAADAEVLWVNNTSDRPPFQYVCLVLVERIRKPTIIDPSECVVNGLRPRGSRGGFSSLSGMPVIQRKVIRIEQAELCSVRYV